MSATNWEDAYRVQTARIAELERENAELRAHAERVGEANDRLAVENDALRPTLDAIIAADERAVKLWRAAHADKELVIPDRGRLVGWLLEQNDALRKDKARLDFLSTLTGSGWACLHLDNKGTNDDWFLTRKSIDRRMTTEPKQ